MKLVFTILLFAFTLATVAPASGAGVWSGSQASFKKHASGAHHTWVSTAPEFRFEKDELEPSEPVETFVFETQVVESVVLTPPTSSLVHSVEIPLYLMACTIRI